jgi:AraC-like DNA-binding protein
MLILAHLPSARLRYLSDIVRPDHRTVGVHTWGEFLESMQTLRPHVVVVDPTPVVFGLDTAIDAIKAAAASVPVLLYTALSPSAARAVQSLRASGTCIWVLEGIDDEPARLRMLLDRHRRPGREEALVIPLLAALGVTAGGPQLATPIRELFQTPGRFHGAKDLASAAGMSLRWLNVCLAAAGLASAGVVVAAARVFAAFEQLQDRECSIGQVAALLHYRDVKSLRRQAVAFTGLVPSAWARDLSNEACIVRVASRLGIRPDRPFVLLRAAARD